MTTSLNWPVRTILAALLSAQCLSTASAADAVSWKLDPAKSRLGFSGTQTGAKFEGKFTRYGADIIFDPDHLDASHITVTVDLASAATGDTQRDTALPGKDWFDIAEFPQAKFDTTAIRKQRATAYEAVGNLTLRGVTKPLTLPFTLQIDGATAHAIGHARLVRTVFGIGQGPWATGQWVALDVDVNLDIVATRGN
jgi:polyisoprenoid-binding protein YceI